MPPPPPFWPPVPLQPPPVQAGFSNSLLTLDTVQLFTAPAGSLTSTLLDDFRFSATNFHYSLVVPADTQRVRVRATTMSRREFVDVSLGEFGQVDPGAN
jgi:hypothetical protein